MPAPRSHNQTARVTRGESDARAGAARARPQGENRTGAGRPRPQRVVETLARSKVKWDRKFRAVMVIVLVLVSWIGVKAGLSLIATHAQAERELQLVSTLAKSNHRLEARKRALNQRATIIQSARALGMVAPGERPYVIVGREH